MEIGGELSGEAANEPTEDAPPSAPVQEEVASPSLPIPENASPELARLMEERERVNAEVQRLNHVVDTDRNTDPSAQVRLNRYPMASRSDVERLNRLTQERLALNQQIQQLQGQP